MEITLASGNKKKLEELNEILKDASLSVVSINPEDDIDIVEDQDTFVGNATIKALAYAKHLNKIVLSDDSGLCVEALNNLPGVFSKRYSGLGDYENNIKLLKALEGKTNRNAYFECVLALAFPNGKVFTYSGKFEGEIAYEIEGEAGFGYDPIFIPKGMQTSVASLDKNYKKMHSHRALAIKQLLDNKDEFINYWKNL